MNKSSKKSNSFNESNKKTSKKNNNLQLEIQNKINELLPEKKYFNTFEIHQKKK